MRLPYVRAIALSGSGWQIHSETEGNLQPVSEGWTDSSPAPLLESSLHLGTAAVISNAYLFMRPSKTNSPSDINSMN